MVGNVSNFDWLSWIVAGPDHGTPSNMVLAGRLWEIRKELMAVVVAAHDFRSHIRGIEESILGEDSTDRLNELRKAIAALAAKRGEVEK